MSVLNMSRNEESEMSKAEVLFHIRLHLQMFLFSESFKSLSFSDSFHFSNVFNQFYCKPFFHLFGKQITKLYLHNPVFNAI